MDYKTILVEAEGDIRIITLNRPEARNAMSRQVTDELNDAFDKLEEDKTARCTILTGAGDAFSAGADMAANRAGPVADANGKVWIADWLERWEKSDLLSTTRLLRIFYLSKPVIAAINGWCMGVGFWHATACDISIASERAVFAQPEVRHIANTTVLFAALCGWKVANRYALTGDHFDAQEALRIGLVNEVVPHDQLMDRAKYLAHRIAKVPEASVRLNKYITTLGLEAMGLRSGMLVNSLLSTIVHSSNNPYQQELYDTINNEGMRAFIRKRDDPFLPEPFGPRSEKGRISR